MLLKKGQTKEALAELQRSDQLQPNMLDTLSDLGKAYIMENQIEAAENAFRRIIAINDADEIANCRKEPGPNRGLAGILSYTFPNAVNTRHQMKLDGIVPIIPTPFNVEEQIDWRTMRQLLEFAGSVAVSAVCLPAYASEFYKLSNDERCELIALAAKHLDGRVPVIAQANSVSAARAVELGRVAQDAGAAAVAIAVPRQFAVRDRDLLRYFDRILCAIDVPLLMQDFNPGGPTVSAEFLAQLHRVHPHFRWVKAGRADDGGPRAVHPRCHRRRGGRAGRLRWHVYAGAGGRRGLRRHAGARPGGFAGPHLRAGQGRAQAGRIRRCPGVLPQIVFSLQSMELYHHAEKRLLATRGIIG